MEICDINMAWSWACKYMHINHPIMSVVPHSAVRGACGCVSGRVGPLNVLMHNGYAEGRCTIVGRGALGITT